MGLNEIPKQYEYSCDVCNYMHDKRQYYNSGRPPHWTQLILRREGYDMTGAAACDASISFLMCPKCTDIVVEKMNALKDSAQ